MKKSLTLALIVVSLFAGNAVARGRCCKKACPPKCAPKKRCAQSEEVARFGYVHQTCEIPTTMPGYQYTECVVTCSKNPCNPCFDTQQGAAAGLEENGYQVISSGDVQSHIAQVAGQHASMGAR